MRGSTRTLRNNWGYRPDLKARGVGQEYTAYDLSKLGDRPNSPRELGKIGTVPDNAGHGAWQHGERSASALYFDLVRLGFLPFRQRDGKHAILVLGCHFAFIDRRRQR